MKRLTKTFKKLINQFGYEIINRKESKLCPLRNFENLARGYEYLLGKLDGFAISEDCNRHRLMARLLGTPPAEAYAIVQAIDATKSLSGDICEFGVAQGETSALIANEIIMSEKVYHLFDSFQGLPEPTDKDELINDLFSLGSMKAYTGTMKFPEEMVVRRLKAVSFPEHRYVIHNGFIKDVLIKSNTLPKCISFAYVDFDFYEPILQTLYFIDSVSIRGTVIIVDDYNYFSSGAKTAVDEFITKKNVGQEKYTSIVPDNKLGYYVILKRIA